MTARVLVVDDILSNVKLLEAKLTAEYFEVLTASSGEQALTRFLDESRSARGFVVKNDFVSAAVRTPKTDANFIEINLKHAAESAMQGIPKRFSGLTVGGWPDDQTERLEDMSVSDGVVVIRCRALRVSCERRHVLQPTVDAGLLILLPTTTWFDKGDWFASPAEAAEAKAFVT
jgi:CheY-like chemotaxis protein